MIATVSVQGEGAECACVDLGDPLADAASVKPDWAGLAAAHGVTQAEVQRQAWRAFALIVEAVVGLPPPTEKIERDPDDVRAEALREVPKLRAETPAKEEVEDGFIKGEGV